MYSRCNVSVWHEKLNISNTRTNCQLQLQIIVYFIQRNFPAIFQVKTHKKYWLCCVFEFNLHRVIHLIGVGKEFEISLLYLLKLESEKNSKHTLHLISRMTTSSNLKEVPILINLFLHDFPFWYTLKTNVFLMFSGEIKREHLEEMI